MLKRRTLVSGGAILLAAQAMSSQLASAQGGAGRVALRTSKLYNSPEPLRSSTVTESMIISIFGDPSGNRSGISATSFNGGLLWQHQLPPALYNGVGTAQSDKLIVLYATNYVISEKRRLAGCILCLDPTTGSTRLVEDVSASIRVPLYFAGSSFLAAMGRDGVQLWIVHSDLKLEKIGPPTHIDGSYTHLDVLSPGLVSLLHREGTVFHTISVPAGIVSRRQLTASPELSDARALAGKVRLEAGMSADVRMPIISVTGSDQNGTLYGLVLPIPIGAPTPMIAISASGSISNWGACQTAPFGGGLGSPRKIVKAGSNLGIIYASGTVGWYQA